MFNYGSFKLFFLKVFFGIIFILFASLLALSLATYSPDDPGIAKYGDKYEVSNSLGMFGAKLSSFFFTIFGALSFLLALYVFYVGWVLLLGIKKRLLSIRKRPLGIQKTLLGIQKDF